MFLKGSFKGDLSITWDDMKAQVDTRGESDVSRGIHWPWSPGQSGHWSSACHKEAEEKDGVEE